MRNGKGLLKIIKSDKGSFLVCTLGREKSGYLSSPPRNKKQAKALISNKCPNCNGALRLYLPKEKDKSPALFCIKDGCKGALWFNDKGGLVVAKSSNSANSVTGNGNGVGVGVASKQEIGDPCAKCGKPTVKRSFKKKDGKEGQFWGCSNWAKGNGCDAAPVWIN